jgi:hypothetical protein
VTQGQRSWFRGPGAGFVFMLVASLSLASATLAQEFFRPAQRAPRGEQFDNTPYDGRFVFIRLRYGSGLSGIGYGGLAPWAHDYPRADVNFMQILNEVTLMKPRMDGSNILALDDPELHYFPVAYMSEPGFWRPTAPEVEGLRAYLLKGGFIIFDDFDGPDWDNLKVQMSRVLPENHFVELDGTHPVFHSFFDIDDPLSFISYYDAGPPTFWGIHEGNDPQKRLVAIANVNNDIGEFWEFSGTGLVPIDLSNEAYKFGVNYVVYAMTH